mgnify:CR=1 FL=1
MNVFRTCFIALLALPYLLVSQDKKKEAAFKKACITITDAFAKQNFKTLNKYIKRENGVYTITRPGAMDAVSKFDSLNKTSFQFYPYKDAISVKKFALKYGTAPKFDCGTEKWDKKGFVADTSQHKRLSELMDFLVKQELSQEDQAARDKIRKLEANCRRVVFTELAKKHGLVFYLTLIDNKWYLFLIDTVASDCGA